MPRHTPLTALHRTLGAQMAEFAGFEMPIVYESIQAEHEAVRNRAGLFDLCHMARFEVRGADAARLLDRTVTNRVLDMRPGEARYGVFCQPDGGVVDDLIYYRLPDETGYLVVGNAANRETDRAWLTEHAGDLDVDLVDRSDDLAMLALQGPSSEEILAPLVAEGTLPGRHELARVRLLDVDAWVARTGYTGEDGFELYFPAAEAERIWTAITDRSVPPVGLGARDTLRTEAAMPLYGHELSRTIHPFEAGIGFCVRFDGKGPYVGREALARIREEGPARKLVCLVAEGRRIPRHGQPIRLPDGTGPIGVVTSGTFSPTLGRPIAMGLVEREHAARGTRLVVDVRGRPVETTVVRRPFYKREPS